jgi:hypothetical protein
MVLRAPLLHAAAAAAIAQLTTNALEMLTRFIDPSWSWSLLSTSTVTVHAMCRAKRIGCGSGT